MDIVIRVLLSLVLLACSSQSLSAEKLTLKLKVAPHLCLRYAETDTCKVDVQISWSSKTSGNYCIHSSDQQNPLQCWQAKNSGKRTELKLLKSDIRYWLSYEGSKEELVSADLKLATVVKNKKREMRQRRHIWSLI